MNPNSTHQLWSRWTTTIVVAFHQTHVAPAFREEMKRATARVYRQMFGSATELKIDHEIIVDRSRFVVDCRTEGAPAPDPSFRKRQMNEIAAFFGKNLGRYGKVDVRVDVRVEAGDSGDGKPPAQLILGPPLVLMPRGVLLGQ